MMTAATAVLVVAGAGAAALAAYSGAVAFHIARTMVRVPRARAGLRLPGASGPGGPLVRVVVPAHNEEGCIGVVARSLAAQDYPGLRLVFVLDRCTDGTRGELEAAVGGDDRVRVVEIDRPPPAGWAGKTHAMWTGATRVDDAAPDVLLFVDADTRLHPSCVRACVGLLRGRGLAVLSLLSTLTADRWFERVAQPTAGMELLRQYPLTRAGAAPERRRAFANGQFIMATREAYERVGTHEAVKGAVLEDVHFAREVARHGLSAGVFFAGEMLHCRMYGSWEEFRRGWKRIYSESANRKPSRLRKNALRVRVLGTVLPLVSLLGLVLGAAAAGPGDGAARGATLACGVGLAVWLVVTAVQYALGRAPVWAAPSAAVGSWLVGGIMREAAADLDAGRPTAWAGMTYAQQKR